jgi:Tfp pilus assembly PilM family ATPase
LPNPVKKIVSPRYPSAAVGLEYRSASVVELERVRGGSARIRRAANVGLDDSLLRPDFSERNIPDPAALASMLQDLAASAGLLKQKRWSLSLPEESIRTAIVTLETAPSSSPELEDILSWKIERTLGLQLSELSLSRERLPPDAQGRTRYLIAAARSEVIAEYESMLASLGWRAGLLLPRHLGEAQWLSKNDVKSDSLLLSSGDHGFTALVVRGEEPLILRKVSCDPQDREDELHRLLLFYSERRSKDQAEALARLLVLGEGLSRTRVAEIINETLGTALRPLEAEDLGLEIPSRELSFDVLAGPAGLAKLSLN